MGRLLRRSGSDTGAETLEFALLAPVVCFMVFGVMYALLVVSANVSLAHAASTAVRYGSIPTDNVEPVYPGEGEVVAKLFDSTPFFTAASCVTSLAGDARPNAPLTLNVSCPFANPLGTALNGLRKLFVGGEDDPFGNSFQLSATAVGRRE